jgi:uncharacterized protein with NRDE domain
MCTLALFFHVFPEYPIVIAANRDEDLSRPSSGPEQLTSSPWIIGGKDLLAGGTWLGVNAQGVAVGVLNRQSSEPMDPQARSRGQLCLDALKQHSAEAALCFLLTQDDSKYNPFNLVLVDATSAYVVDNHVSSLTVHKLPTGIHLVTNRNANDPSCSRIARFSSLFAEDVAHAKKWNPALPHFFSLLHQRMATHAEPTAEARDGLCIHLDGYGTRSSTFLAYAKEERFFRYHFAPGPPCRTHYKEVELPSPTFTSQPPSAV